MDADGEESRRPSRPPVGRPAALGAIVPRAMRGEQPEVRLMLATLNDAIAIVTRGPRKGQRFAETRAWFLSDEADLFACATLCDVLEVDLPALRRHLAPFLEPAHLRLPAVPAMRH